MKQNLIPEELPHGTAIVQAGRELGASLTLGRSLLCAEHGVASEVAYKRKMNDEGRVTTAMNIGMQTWSQTADALRSIHAACAERGFRIDRYQMNLDRRMGLPRQFWSRAAKETGPMLESREDWQEVAQVVPIQPHLGDMMIGSPASVSNACQALEAGVNYIGNLSQFHWKYPGWPGTDAEQVSETVKALGVMAAHAENGAMVHSYLDDGFPAQFSDFTSYLGWARFERYVVDELIGARLSVSYGGLTHQPIAKAAMILALERTTPPGHMNAFYHGNTTAYARVLDQNFGVCSVDILYMTLARQRAGGGAAILAVPVTEPVRTPTWEEIVQVQTAARRVIDDAPKVDEAVAWEHMERIGERLVEGGERFYQNLLNGLVDSGMDERDPLQLLLAVRRLGAKELEQRYGIGTPDPASGGDRTPAVPSDTYLDFIARRHSTRAELRSALAEERATDGAADARILVASADVHEYALNLLVDALDSLGLAPCSAGTSVDPDELARLAGEQQAELVLVSTHNGMALAYAQQLIAELKFRGLAPKIAFGGVINQDDAAADAPIDVTAELQRMGIEVCQEIRHISKLIIGSRGSA